MTGYMLRPTPNPDRSGRDGIAEHAPQRYKLIVHLGRHGGYPAALKDVIDSAYKEWAEKPVAFISFRARPGRGDELLAL